MNELKHTLRLLPLGFVSGIILFSFTYFNLTNEQFNAVFLFGPGLTLGLLLGIYLYIYKIQLFRIKDIFLLCLSMMAAWSFILFSSTMIGFIIGSILHDRLYVAVIVFYLIVASWGNFIFLLVLEGFLPKVIKSKNKLILLGSGILLIFIWVIFNKENSFSEVFKPENSFATISSLILIWQIGIFATLGFILDKKVEKSVLAEPRDSFKITKAPPPSSEVLARRKRRGYLTGIIFLLDIGILYISYILNNSFLLYVGIILMILIYISIGFSLYSRIMSVDK